MTRMTIPSASDIKGGAGSQQQEVVFRFLADPNTHGGTPVQRIDTHTAVVFLAGPRAFKVKRAVRFPFLDFSTHEKRKAACEAELKVNRAFAPDLYRRVLPITRESNGKLTLAGQGVPVEWAVEMQRFDERQTLDQLADRQQLDCALAGRLAAAVAAAHKIYPRVAGGPWIEHFARCIDQNETELAAYPSVFPGTDVQMLFASTRAAFARNRPLLERRGEGGFVRRGHGDLHLGNIILMEGTPILFDAIEFDPMMASGDVLYDLAFLLMDLFDRDLSAAANIVLNRYLTEFNRIDDVDGLAALPLFLSMRAAIRAKVTAARAKYVAAEARTEVTEQARSYFRLAVRLLKPQASILVAIGGLSGTGKSLLARGLAPEVGVAPGAVVLRSDVERKALFGLRETDQLPETAYAYAVSANVYAHLFEKSRRLVSAGHSVILDAVFARAVERAKVADLARCENFTFIGLFLTADLATRTARVARRTADASDADTRIAELQERYDVGRIDWHQVDASGTPDVTLRHAKGVLRLATEPLRER